ncbi:MAG: flagellar motor protein MotA [Alphaproteobacteria bacterium]|nr:flagellar motor protein MotA [Alphaproteobacteria bacterium]
MNSFHRNLNRMALFTALLLCGIILFYRSFFTIAISNIYLNGIIIGTTIYGIILCFIKVFQLLPEHRWLNMYTNGGRAPGVAPRLLHSVALLLHNRPAKMDGNTLRSILDMILVRFEDDRESVRYITNTLIFLGLLGTFWGLILTVGGFAELIGNLNFNDATVLESMQSGLSRPLGGMATAFTSSLLGLAGSLIIGFLGLQVQLAQGAIFHKLEDFLSRRTNVAQSNIPSQVLPKIQSDTAQINQTLQNLDKRINAA